MVLNQGPQPFALPQRFASLGVVSLDHAGPTHDEFISAFDTRDDRGNERGSVSVVLARLIGSPDLPPRLLVEGNKESRRAGAAVEDDQIAVQDWRGAVAIEMKESSEFTM